MAIKSSDQTTTEETSVPAAAAVPAASAEDLAVKSEGLIKNYVMAAGAASLVPLPLADLAAITGVQVLMIKKLAELHGKTFSEAPVRNTISALAGGFVGHSAGVAAAVSLTKFIPGVGVLFGTMTLPVLAGATTYALGRVYQRHFEEGGSVVDVSVEGVRDYFKEQVENGKKVAQSAKAQIHKHTAPAEQPA